MNVNVAGGGVKLLHATHQWAAQWAIVGRVRTLRKSPEIYVVT